MTLQAVNYCAHALDDFNLYAKMAPSLHPGDVDLNYIASLTGKIKNSQKFALPDYGRVLEFSGQDIKSFIGKYCHELRLPYPVVALEYPHPETDMSGSGTTDFDAVIAIAEEVVEDGERVIVVYPFCRARHENKRFWVPVNFAAHVSLGHGLRVKPVTAFGIRAIEENGDSYIKQACEDVKNEVSAVLSLIAALACTNVGQELLPASDALNKKRLKANKQPFFSYKVLNLKPGKAMVEAGAGNRSHASPRIHLRRGHIRRLEGRTVWVNASVVGNKALGMVQKDYRMAA